MRIRLLTVSGAATLALLSALVLPAGAGAQSPTLSLFGKWTSTVTAALPTGDGSVMQLVTTNTDTYVLMSDGTVWSYGDDTFGELGNGTVAHTWTTTPTPVDFTLPPGVVITQLATVGPNATELAIDSQHDVWGWGLNSFGQLCLGNESVQPSPVQLPFTNVQQAIGAGSHASYYTKTGTTQALYSCGGNDNGQLGNGTFTSSLSPVPVSDLPNESIAFLTAAWNNMGAVMADGTFWVWGYNAYGELGNDSTTDSPVPVEVPLQAPVAEAAQGGGGPTDGQTLVVLTDQTTWAWGNDSWGQLCLGTVTSTIKRPHEVSGSWTAVASGGTTQYLKNANGRLWACGDDSQNQFGDGGSSTVQSLPVRTPFKGVDQFSSTNFNAAALTG